MELQDWIILAYQLDGHGGGTTLNHQDIIEGNLKGLHWLHLNANYLETKTWLKETSGLDHFCVEALTADETRPRVMEVDDGAALVILRGVNLNENAEPEDMVSIRLYIDKKRIISVRKRQLKAVLDIEESLQRSYGPKTPGEFLSTLAYRLCERMAPTLTHLNELIDDIEQNVIDNPDIKLRQTIIDTRKQTILFRRYLAPQRDVLSQLRMTDLKFLNTQDKRHLQEGHNAIARYVEDLDAARERTQIVQDELTNYLSDHLNHNMYLLSVIAAIFLPLGFLTGLLGINVGGIPGADNPNAFWAFAGGLGAIVFLQIMLFKLLRWF